MEITIEPLRIVSAQLNILAAEAVALIPNMIAALLVLGLTALAAGLIGGAVRRVMVRSRARPALTQALRRLTRIVVWLLGLLLTATLLFPDLTATRALAGLGLGSLVIGLAFKDIFENFLAGFLILLRKPMRTGDDILCEGVQGRVERISLRDTFVRKRSGELVLVPNSFLFRNPVEILTDRDFRRITLTVPVAYGTDVDAAREVIRAAVEAIPTRESGEVQVFAGEFDAYSIDFLVRWWARSAPIDEHRSRDEAVAAVKRALEGAGVEIPVPYRRILWDGAPVRPEPPS